MSTTTATAQNCSLFEIDAELEAAFDQLQEEREITGNISDESREHCVQLFAEVGKKVDRIALLVFLAQSFSLSFQSCSFPFPFLPLLTQPLVLSA